ncbi:hypothetical protein [Ancylobacter aquaticus]|uniref:hypothetical protein n=1 Tax=Ancylobacter aquaticus TaxID=100 RepID=UPI00105399D8|nr:hypothetical protein [Ancylobacter aquaticus]
MPRLGEGALPGLLPEARALMALPNVIATGFGRKFTGGKATGERCLVVHVEAKTDDLPAQGCVPSEIATRGGGALRTDVVGCGHMRALALRSGEGLLSFDNQTGVCALTFHTERGAFALTCAHVVTDLSGALPRPVRWRPASGVAGAGHAVLATRLSAPVIAADAAVIELLPGIAAGAWEVEGGNAYINALDIFREGEGTEYFYVTPRGTVYCGFPQQMAGGSVAIDGAVRTVGRYWSLRVPAGGGGLPAREGDSGALVLRRGIGGYVAMGLVFAGTPAGAEQQVGVFPFRVVWDSLALGVLPL